MKRPASGSRPPSSRRRCTDVRRLHSWITFLRYETQIACAQVAYLEKPASTCLAAPCQQLSCEKILQVHSTVFTWRPCCHSVWTHGSTHKYLSCVVIRPARKTYRSSSARFAGQLLSLAILRGSVQRDSSMHNHGQRGVPTRSDQDPGPRNKFTLQPAAGSSTGMHPLATARGMSFCVLGHHEDRVLAFSGRVDRAGRITAVGGRGDTGRTTSA